MNKIGSITTLDDTAKTSYTCPKKAIYYLFYYGTWTSAGSHSDLLLNGKYIGGNLIPNNNGSMWSYVSVIANEGDIITCSTGSQFRMESYQEI